MIFKRNKIAAIALCGVFTAALATPFSAGISASAEEEVMTYAEPQTAFSITCPLRVHPPISPRFK